MERDNTRTGKLSNTHGRVVCSIRNIGLDTAMVQLQRTFCGEAILWENDTCSVYAGKVRWQHGRLVGLQIIDPDDQERRLRDCLNNCLTYALAHAA